MSISAEEATAFRGEESDRLCRFAKRHLRLEDGRPLVVEGFQQKMLADYFAGTTETIILTPKKQGKSTLVARSSRGPGRPRPRLP